MAFFYPNLQTLLYTIWIFQWIILYDIRDSKRLQKVAKTIQSYGWRVQKSVFESDADESTMEILEKRLLSIIDKTSDFIMFLNVCERDWQKQESYGNFENNKIQSAEYVIL